MHLKVFSPFSIAWNACAFASYEVVSGRVPGIEVDDPVCEPLGEQAAELSPVTRQHHKIGFKKLFNKRNHGRIVKNSSTVV